LVMPPRKGLVSASAGEIFRVRFPQVTGAVMAKGREDTAYFVYNRLMALDEVGADPQSPGTDPAAFHAANALRLKHYPHSMLTTSTHDTKMSEDARARALAISEIPSLWRNFLEHAVTANLPHKTIVNGQLAPDKNEEYRFYQILLATWPLDKMPSHSRRFYVQRIQQCMLKSLREEKVHSFWSAPKADWEKAVENFVFKVINQPGPEFRAHFQALAKKIAQLGMVNSLSQTLLKLTVPGVPDIFQGNEIWQFLLTDPDNRRPVDFASRQKILASLAHESPESLLSNWQTGAIKLFVTRALLRYRKDHRLLFQRGKYSPLEFSGTHKNNCVGFARQHGKDLLLVFAPRLTDDLGFPPVGRLWGRTRLKTPGFDRRIFRDIFTERVIHGTELKLATIFADLPVAVLAAEQN
jgi:(1->4)-alpha-D-glucan 1-alpha-D-glucosylmutase